MVCFDRPEPGSICFDRLDPSCLAVYDSAIFDRGRTFRLCSTEEKQIDRVQPRSFGLFDYGFSVELWHVFDPPPSNYKSQTLAREWHLFCRWARLNRDNLIKEKRRSRSGKIKIFAFWITITRSSNNFNLHNFLLKVMDNMSKNIHFMNFFTRLLMLLSFLCWSYCCSLR